MYSGHHGSVCFRATRRCNLRCAFCQAPFCGDELPCQQTVLALNRLKGHGVRRVKITGGEPLIRSDLHCIVDACRSLSMDVTLSTNGTLLDSFWIQRLVAADAKVKISLHGHKPAHNDMVGAYVYDIVVANLRNCVDAGLRTSIHTVLTRKNAEVIPDMVRFCEACEISKITFIPFIPRGLGRTVASQYQLDKQELTQLQGDIASLRTQSIVDIRYMDLWHKGYFTLETDGRLIVSRETESKDVFLEQLVGKHETP